MCNARHPNLVSSYVPAEFLSISLASFNLCRCLEVSVTVSLSWRESWESFNLFFWSASITLILSGLDNSKSNLCNLSKVLQSLDVNLWINTEI